ncbi:DUF6394 family protein [Propionimicrobium lymphophilum]|uniref:Uncharacterized protein n=1 Tax=Propionimicrobium lymphophilum ACS-093-V-SCH5 TaxID=883161 RepID=S2VZV1_9ACTN|nr:MULTISPECIES: DUF6394 family protein [Propionimicrobium]EPD32406.1 hypothetical protein HMPREF9306_01977 [Propionimicrobium lymphophilum ACS-093-V-SCH5]ETJ96784.1 hypothetical protein HMPREF1255_0861 [Propionimicrobium sp. BV2F7]MDK7710777.1 DUF6394 family protein [Propionimicrobium lymphophilum]MDK7734411.1 DUF6394 family protein [Propionimicrobium lymphophilum]
MNLEKVVFGFFITMAAALNFGFWYGPISEPAMHNGAELMAALVTSLIATVLKFGDRTQLGAVHLSTSLVADLQLIVGVIVWVICSEMTTTGLTSTHISVVVSLSAGAMLANAVSVVLMVGELLQARR